MSELKRIVRSELEAIIEEGIRESQEREAIEVSGMHPHYGRKEPDRTMSKLGAKVYGNEKRNSRWGKKESR